MKERPTNIVCNYSTQQFPVSMQFKIFVYCVNFQQYQKKKNDKESDLYQILG